MIEPADCRRRILGRTHEDITERGTIKARSLAEQESAAPRSTRLSCRSGTSVESVLTTVSESAAVDAFDRDGAFGGSGETSRRAAGARGHVATRPPTNVATAAGAAEELLELDHRINRQLIQANEPGRAPR